VKQGVSKRGVQGDIRGLRFQPLFQKGHELLVQFCGIQSGEVDRLPTLGAFSLAEVLEKTEHRLAEDPLLLVEQEVEEESRFLLIVETTI
jgi:hypothetical protein